MSGLQPVVWNWRKNALGQVLLTPCLRVLTGRYSAGELVTGEVY